MIALCDLENCHVAPQGNVRFEGRLEALGGYLVAGCAVPCCVAADAGKPPPANGGGRVAAIGVMEQPSVKRAGLGDDDDLLIPGNGITPRIHHRGSGAAPGCEYHGCEAMFLLYSRQRAGGGECRRD